MMRCLRVGLIVLVAIAARPAFAELAVSSSLPKDRGTLLVYGEAENAANAAVLIDGERRGLMPATAETGFRIVLPAGTHTIELRRGADNRFYQFTARAVVTIDKDALVPVTMPALMPSPLLDSGLLVDAVVNAFVSGMVTIPAGAFMMGGRDEEDSADNEFPRHKVTIARPFLMQTKNVTFDQWDACVADGACASVPDDEGHGRGGHDVINVSWEDARHFAQWLSRRLHRACWIPTEAEWEYAARGGTQTTYFFGDDTTRMADYVAMGRHFATEARPNLANPYGLLAMMGGASEWVQDCYNTSYSGAPDDGSAWIGGDCKARVVRGGIWDAGPWYMRSARRSAMNPANHYNYVGLRMACSTQERARR